MNMLPKLLVGRLLPGLLVLSPALAAPSDDLFWTLDPKAMKMSEAPVHGRVTGTPEFVPENVTVEVWGTTLTFQQTQGKNTTSVTLQLPEFKLSGQIEGQTLEHTPANMKPYVEPVTLARVTWSQEERSRVGNDSFHGNFALRLQLGKISNGVLPAQICLCLPDEAKSVVTGRFSIKGPAGVALRLAAMTGRVRTPVAMNEKALYVGSAWLNDREKVESTGAHLRLTKNGELPPGASSSMTGNFSLNGSAKDGASYSLKQCARGWHLVVVAGSEITVMPEPKRPDGFPAMPGFGPRENLEPLPRVYDCRWVEVPDERAEVTCDLTVDPARLGFVHVAVPDVRDGTYVTFLPATDKQAPDAAAYHGGNPALRAKVNGGETGIISLPPGTYDFQCLGRSKQVKIEPGKSVKFTLPAGG